MNGFHRTLPISALALLLTSTGAMAQVTAQQVWDDWMSLFKTAPGVTVTIGSENYAGGVLTITDFAIAAEEPGSSVTGSIPQMVLTEQADGSVQIVSSDSQTFTGTGTDPEGSVTSFSLSLNQPGAVIVASGAPGAMSYALTAPRYEMQLGSFVSDGEPLPIEAVVGIDGIAGTLTTAEAGALRNISYNLTASAVDMKFVAAEPGTSNTMTFNGTLADLAANAVLAIPVLAEDAGPQDMFAAGLAVDVSESIGAGRFDFSLNDQGTLVQGALDLSGGEVGIVMSRERLDYSLALRGLAMNATVPDLPFPLAYSTDELAVGISMPMTPTPEPAAFAARVRVANMAITDDLWAMFDPGTIIPRDPATIDIDLSGTATLTADLTSGNEADLLGETAPGELNSFDINTFTLAFGGAHASAGGSFTFDNSDLVTFEGMPRPTGRLDVTLNGVNGLLQKLGQIGLLPPDQAMGMTMMMGMFAVPTGDDQLSSSIEFTADGQILANGMPMMPSP
ncbi:MAG: DUF2125 domain-containing protein [Rubellimicrobium sp.]|nr:DUF2125 domain-containing protein [Rubellimicrobium sp.]